MPNLSVLLTDRFMTEQYADTELTVYRDVVYSVRLDSGTHQRFRQSLHYGAAAGYDAYGRSVAWRAVLAGVESVFAGTVTVGRAGVMRTPPYSSAAGAMAAPAEVPDRAQNVTTAQDGEPEPKTDQADDATRQEPHVPGGIAASGLKSDHGGGNAEDRQLKETVAELKTLYKAVMEALKRKLQAGRGAGKRLHASLQLQVYAVMPESAGNVAVKV